MVCRHHRRGSSDEPPSPPLQSPPPLKPPDQRRRARLGIEPGLRACVRRRRRRLRWRRRRRRQQRAYVKQAPPLERARRGAVVFAASAALLPRRARCAAAGCGRATAAVGVPPQRGAVGRVRRRSLNWKIAASKLSASGVGTAPAVTPTKRRGGDGGATAAGGSATAAEMATLLLRRIARSSASAAAGCLLRPQLHDTMPLECAHAGRHRTARRGLSAAIRPRLRALGVRTHPVAARSRNRRSGRAGLPKSGGAQAAGTISCRPVTCIWPPGSQLWGWGWAAPLAPLRGRERADDGGGRPRRR